MNLFDPLRAKTLSDMPALQASVDAVPILYLDPVSATEVEFSAWVRTKDGSGFVSRSHRVYLSLLGKFMADFINDPEGILRAHFDWTPHMTRVTRDEGDALPKARVSKDDGVATPVTEDEI